MRLFGHKRDQITGGLRKLHNVELRNLYASPNIVRVIELKTMGWEGHVAQLGEVAN
jgi:hypothetical protein